MFWKTFRWSFVITGLSLILAYVYGGWQALALCIILGILEVSLSFDNAVLNATILRKMSPFWQKIFLTIGIVIAVFGMRLIFPLVIVGVAANISPLEAFQLALQKGDPDVPGTYGYIFTSIQPVVAAFGGTFLLMLFLTFMLNDNEVKWLTWVERPLAILGKIPLISIITTCLTLAVVAMSVHSSDQTRVLIAGATGIILFVAIHWIGETFKRFGSEEAGSATVAVGKAGFFLFLYLEILDATLSFDGAIGAFAITSDPIIIALGLGFIGAIFVRSLTVYMVKQQTLESFIYLEHGAHWAIGALAVLLLSTITIHISELITGGVGLFFISAAVVASMVAQRKSDSKST